MAKNVIYRIQMKNWEKYNSTKRASFATAMVSCRFLDDAKILTLSPRLKLLVLLCILNAPAQGQGSIELGATHIQSSTGVRHSEIPSSLKTLESLQLLTWDIVSLSKEVSKEVRANALALVPDGPSSPKINQNEICVIERAEDFSILLEQKHFDNWAKIYEIPYMKMELVKMTSWLLTNPSKNRKTRRGLTQFVGNWFNRGWDRYLNSQKSNGGGGEHRSSFTGVADV